MNEPTENGQLADEKLNDLFNKLIALYEKQVKLNHSVATDSEEIARIANQLISQTEAIGRYEEGIRKRIQDVIKEAGVSAISNIEKAIDDKIYLQPIISYWKMFAAGVFAIAIFSTATFFIASKQSNHLTDEQLRYLQIGKAVSDVWPNLSKNERDNIRKIMGYKYE